MHDCDAKFMVFEVLNKDLIIGSCMKMQVGITLYSSIRLTICLAMKARSMPLAAPTIVSILRTS